MRFRWRRWLGVPLVLALVLWGGFHLLVRTEWFEQKVRERVVAEIELATGGRVEIGEFEFQPENLAVIVRDLTLHGSEPPSEPPLLTASLLRIEISIGTLLAPNISLVALEIESPEVHVTVNEDGATNLPRRAGGGSPGAAATDLLDLAVGRFEVRDGRVFWNHRPHKFSVAAQEVELESSYEYLTERYAIQAKAGRSSVEISGRQPIVSRTEANLFLYRDRIEVPTISLAGDDWKAQGQMNVLDLAEPVISLEYEWQGAVRPWAAWAGLSTVTAGQAALAGQFEWTTPTGQLSHGGKLDARGLRFEEGAVLLSDVAVTAQYSGDRDHVLVENLNVAALGGSFLGEARVNGLSEQAPPQWRVDGDLDGFELRSIFASAAGKRLPGWETGFPWTSGVSGWARASGTSWRDLEAAASIVLSASGAMPGQVPVEGVVDATYASSDQAFALSRVDLRTSATRVTAEGKVHADGRSSLELQADLDSLEDVLFAMELAGVDSSGIPLSPAGHARLVGSLQGRISAQWPPQAKFDGFLEAEDFSVAGHKWQSFEGRILADPEGLEIVDGRIEEQTGSITLTAKLALQRGQPAQDSPLSAAIRLHDLAAQKLLAATGRIEPITGRVSGKFDIGGVFSAPEGQGEIEVSSGSLWGEPFDRLQAAVVFRGGIATVSSARLALGSAIAEGNGRLDLSDKSFRFELAGSGLSLAQQARFRGMARRPAGDLRFNLNGSGRAGSGDHRFEELNVAGSWALAGFALGDQPLGALSGNIATDGPQVKLDWQGTLLGGSVTGQAAINAAGDGKFDGDMDLSKIQAIELARLGDLPVEAVSGDMDGVARFSGVMSAPGNLTAEGEVKRLELGLAEIAGSKRRYSLWNPFPMRWTYADGKINLDQMRLLGDGTDIVVDGDVPVGGGTDLNVSLEGTFNLAVLESFRQDLEAGGGSTVEVTIKGDLDDPDIRGTLRLRNASLRSSDFPNGFSEMQGNVHFDRRRIRIEEITATSGGGKLRMTGTAQYGGGAVGYRVTAKAERVRLRYPANISSLIDGQFTFSGTNVRSLLSGEIVVSRASTPQELDLGTILAGLSEPARTPASNDLLQNMQLNVRIGSVPDLAIKTSLIENMQAEIDLRLVGTAVSPTLLGHIGVTQGEMVFQGSRYVINRGDIAFVNPFRIDPVLNFELETRIRDVDIALTISGPARKLNVSYRSDPPLQFNELVALVAVGRSPTTDPVLASQQTVQQQSLIQTGANAILAQALANPFSRGLQRFFGVSRLKVDPQLGGAEANPSARISTEQQITSDLTLIYSYDLSEAQQQTVRIEWAPTRRWSFIVTRDENGLVGSDILYKKRLP